MEAKQAIQPATKITRQNSRGRQSNGPSSAFGRLFWSAILAALLLLAFCSPAYASSENQITKSIGQIQNAIGNQNATVPQSSGKVVKWLFENADGAAETGQAEKWVSPMTAGLVYRNSQTQGSRANAPLWPLLLFGGMMGVFGIAAYAFRKKDGKKGA